MFGSAGGFRRRVVVLEVGAALLFFGSLVHHAELARQGTTALRQLEARGYTVPTGAAPARVYPAATAGSFDSAHAGGWRPGVISLREDPAGSAGPEVYLRHELMHEACFRTCSGRLPLWAEEAAAIAFSGEASAPPQAVPLAAGDLDHLRNRIRLGADMDARSYRTLARLVAAHGWPQSPCAVSEEIRRLATPPPAVAEAGFSYILVSLLSGRTIESGGDMKSRYPPGSLLKIPYAAALRNAPDGPLGEELAASDTKGLLDRWGQLDPVAWRFLVSSSCNTVLARDITPEEYASGDEGFRRQYLGERDPDGGFPLEADLGELARLVRASLLMKPSRFAGLSMNGRAEKTTLFAEPEQDRRILAKLRAMSKTGTAADSRGNPLVGHLAVAWPAPDPTLLAVFRGPGLKGASTLQRASRLLEEWSARYPAEYSRVRVRLLAGVPRASWEVFDECPSFERPGRSGGTERVSACGRFRIVSNVPGSRPERLIRGVLESSADDRQVVLETDPETYADATLAAEAAHLEGEAAMALRAVIVWNGTRGGRRHEDSSSVCDTTHCMVFRGMAPEESPRRAVRTDPRLLTRLDELAARAGLNWLPFSKGGDEKWEKSIPAVELSGLTSEPAILDIRRERTRGGAVLVHLVYPAEEETVPCEVFRNRLKLPSCPDAILHDATRNAWHFTGIGRGHGRGLSVERGGALAKSGRSAEAILRDAYGQ
ncbi:MAG TPA: hypothetical protein PK250_13320 [Syntrophobacter fumaroxidans]|nr:hypothetical protein [Syntrophobacter fumaroxidans]